MTTRPVRTGAFESGGRSFEVTLVLDTNEIEIVEQRGISGDIVARGGWDPARREVMGLVAVHAGWSGDLGQLAKDATARLRSHAASP